MCLETAHYGLRAEAGLAPEDIALYIGIPFCPTRCAYCSFVSNSVEKSFALVEPYLAKGLDVAMLNLGDVSIYATYSYLMQIFKDRGYETVMVPGVPSFCAVAARLGVSLTEMNSPLHIAPGGMALDEVLDQPGTKVLMKSGRQMPAVLDALAARDALGKSMLVQNCGLPEETVYADLSQSRPEGKHGYFSTVIVKE